MSRRERLEDHLPASIPFPCWGRLPSCRVYTEQQLIGFTPAQLATAMKKRTDDCGDCDLFKNQITLNKSEQEREKVERRRIARERANYYAMLEEEGKED